MAVIARLLLDISTAAPMWLIVVADRLEPLITGGLVTNSAVLGCRNALLRA